MQRAIPTLAASLIIIAGHVPLAGQEALCEGAERFLQETMFMIALSESDTIDDWRTQAKVPGCRVTAAGSSSLPSAEVARGFYQIIAESGWSRTPDPRDAPNEASLRFCRGSGGCFFKYYD
ncbi:MAG TPA: hypothetical protein DEB33_05575, partial [Gemmatimonadetes bacterium]|nr:hypothetical protein [Gemmatimonadota bacterium]